MNDSAIIRQFRPSDEARVRDICFATALYGRPMPPAIANRMWMTDALLGYHFRAEPESLFVAVADEVVVGYLAGGTNTLRQQRWFLRNNFAPLLVRAVFSRQFIAPGFWALGLAALGPALAMRRGLRRTASEYPAFLHMNLDVSRRGRGVGKRLLDAFVAMLRARRIPGLHITTGTAAGRAFFAKHGFFPVAEHPIKAVLNLPPGRQCLMARKT